MKYLAIPLFALLLSFMACSGDDGPSVEYTGIAISETYLPASITVGSNDMSLIKKCNELDNKYFMVNSAESLPEDPIGFSPAYSSINYSKYTLLISYRYHAMSFDSYQSTFTRNNYERTYDWFIDLTTSYSESSSVGLKSLTRFAIKVPKLSANAEVRTIWRVYSSGVQ